MAMEQDGIGTPREAEATALNPSTVTGPLDPLEFFRPTDTHEAVATYTKARAMRTVPTTLLVTWARAARAGTLLWALLPIVSAGALLFAHQQPLHLNRLLILAVGTCALLLGVNLVRGATRQVDATHPLGSVLLSSPLARIGAVLLVVGLGVALFAPKWLGPGNAGLGALGLALGGVSLAVALLRGSVPGEELLPAIALGPVLFFLALSTQTLPAVVKHGKTVAAITPSALLHSEWLLAVAFGCLALVGAVAARLARPAAAARGGTAALIGDVGLRVLVLGGLAVAYGATVLAGLARGVPHATIAVLLSLPIAVLPLTTVLRARTSAALRSLFPQVQRTILWFGIWLVGGLILGGAYLHLLKALHGIIK